MEGSVRGVAAAARQRRLLASAADGVPQVAHGERAVHAGVIAREDGARRAHLLRRVGVAAAGWRRLCSDEGVAACPTRGPRASSCRCASRQLEVAIEVAIELEVSQSRSLDVSKSRSLEVSNSRSLELWKSRKSGRVLALDIPLTARAYEADVVKKEPPGVSRAGTGHFVSGARSPCRRLVALLGVGQRELLGRRLETPAAAARAAAAGARVFEAGAAYAEADGGSESTCLRRGARGGA